MLISMYFVRISSKLLRRKLSCEFKLVKALYSGSVPETTLWLLSVDWHLNSAQCWTQFYNWPSQQSQLISDYQTLFFYIEAFPRGTKMDLVGPLKNL